jgi:hypothetical protein
MTVPPRTAGYLLACAAVPALVHAVIEAAFLAAALVGAHPRWPVQDLNLSEAAAVRDTATVARLLDAGEDANGRRLVRDGLLEGVAQRVTPLEAAVSIRRPEIVRLLVAHGARPGAQDWVRLRCYVQRHQYDDIATELEAVRPADASFECSGNEALW